MEEDAVLVVDDDPACIAELCERFAAAGVEAEPVSEGLAAMEKLRLGHYRAIVLDPMIRHRLNGYAVLNYIELQHPEMLSRVYLLTGMSRQTIMRTAPALVPRLFRKPETQKIAAAVIASTAPHAACPPRAPNRSVLLVEDDPQTAKITADALEQLGYACKWLSSGAKVLETVSSAKFDAIMLDLIMPGTDGFTVLDRLEARKAHLLRRVVVTTGMPAHYRDELNRRRICGVLQKPLDLGELRRLLRRCADEAPFEAGGETAVC